jgi:hypothetical protein
LFNCWLQGLEVYVYSIIAVSEGTAFLNVKLNNAKPGPYLFCFGLSDLLPCLCILLIVSESLKRKLLGIHANITHTYVPTKSPP